MVSSRLRNTIVFFALCGLLAGSAFAGTFTSTPTTTTFAHEIATSNLTFAGQVYTMGIGRNLNQHFVMRYTLTNATFAADPTLTYGGEVADIDIVRRSGGANSSSVEFDVNVNALAGTAIGDTFTLNGSLKFAAGAAIGTTAAIKVDLRDVIGAIDVNIADPSTDLKVYSKNLATLAPAARLAAAANIRATINAMITPPLTQFVPVISIPEAADDDSATQAKAYIQVFPSTTDVRNAANDADYALVAGDKVALVIRGDFSGLASVGWDLDNSGTITTTGTTVTNQNPASNEQFFVDADGSYKLIVNGDRITAVAGANRPVIFTAAAAMNSRTFGIEATITPVAASQVRSLATPTSNWFVWTQNGTTLLAPYVSFVPGNGVKFRFTNSSDTAITVLVAITPDVADASTQKINSFTIPANGSRQITFSDLPTTATLEQGPIAELNEESGAVQPVRAKVTFTALSPANYVTGMVLIYSPVGVVTTYFMPQVQ